MNYFDELKEINDRPDMFDETLKMDREDEKSDIDRTMVKLCGIQEGIRNDKHILVNVKCEDSFTTVVYDPRKHQMKYLDMIKVKELLRK